MLNANTKDQEGINLCIEASNTRNKAFMVWACVRQGDSIGSAEMNLLF